MGQTLGGRYQYPIMLCNITQNAMGQTPVGGYPAKSGWGGTQVGYPPAGYPLTRSGWGYPGRYPPVGYPLAGYPPAGYSQVRTGYSGRVPPSRVPPRSGQGGTQVGYPHAGYPPRQVRMEGGTQLGQQKEYSLHDGWYAFCIHAGGFSCDECIH